MANKNTTPATTSARKPSRKKSAERPPTSDEVAALLGAKLTPPLKPEQTARLHKALPGYAGMLDDVAALLKEDSALLNLPDVTPEALLEAQEEQKHLAAREAVAYAVYRSLFEQRLQVDDRAMKMLEKIARRVNALEEDDRDLPGRWKLLLDFLGTFRQGGRKATAAAAEEMTMTQPVA